MSGARERSKEGRPQQKKQRACVVDRDFREDLGWWVRTKPGIASKLLTLVDAVLRDPFSGIGKPEPLKQLGPNIWSRRLTEEHRLVYMVFDDRIVFIQARYHY